jgi:SAM-dependent methyltransferase
MTAAEQIVDLYRRHAGAWAAARGAKLAERAWIDRFAAMLRPGATVLDIGCGSGQPIAAYLAARGHPVAGIDSSPEMIALFRSSLPGEAAEVADMRSLSLDRRFGGLVAWDSFFHLAPHDQRPMFPVFRDHAGPGALFDSNRTFTWFRAAGRLGERVCRGAPGVVRAASCCYQGTGRLRTRDGARAAPLLAVIARWAAARGGVRRAAAVRTAAGAVRTAAEQSGRRGARGGRWRT